MIIFIWVVFNLIFMILQNKNSSKNSIFGRFNLCRSSFNAWLRTTSHSIYFGVFFVKDVDCVKGKNFMCDDVLYVFRDAFQVWSPTHFKCFFVCEKSLISLEGNQWPPRRRNAILIRFSQQLPHLCLTTLKGFLSWYGTLQGPSPSPRLVCCLRGYIITRTPSRVPR